MRHSFRFSGTGGQGLITAGIILAEAALLDDKLAVQSPILRPGSPRRLFQGRGYHQRRAHLFQPCYLPGYSAGNEPGSCQQIHCRLR